MIDNKLQFNVQKVNAIATMTIIEKYNIKSVGPRNGKYRQVDL